MPSRLEFAWLAAGVLVLCLQERPVFRASSQSVTVSVSVKKGNAAIPGLRAEDFVLSDNGVRQQVALVSIESVPIDVTLFTDTSGSTSAAAGAMTDSVRRILGMLRPADRFSVLTIGNSVYRSVPWTHSGALIDPTFRLTKGVSLVHDAVAAALLHRVEGGRRHLIVALTDGRDCGSVITPLKLRILASRSEALVHWVVMTGFSGSRASGSATCDLSVDPDRGALQDVTERSGGEIHSAFIGQPDAVKAFAKILDDFRQMYVLHFAPKDVASSGWHVLRVEVPKAKYAIRARAGYWGS